MEKNKKDIKERSFEFAVRTVKYVQRLPKNNAGYKIGGQLLDAELQWELMLKKRQELLARETLPIKWELH